MASEVDISNLALSHLGDEATVSSIDPPEGSAQAEHCQRFYPIARDAALEAHSWKFATKRVVLASVTNTLDSWAFAYALPADSLRELSVLMPDATDDTDTQEFVVEIDSTNAKVLYTNVETATLRYIARVTDTTRFSPLFINAVSFLLASYLAGPIIKGVESIKVKQGLYNAFMVEVGKARTADANSRKTDHVQNYQPAWIRNR